MFYLIISSFFLKSDSDIDRLRKRCEEGDYWVLTNSFALQMDFSGQLRDGVVGQIRNLLQVGWYCKRLKQIRFPNEEAEDKATVHPSAQHQFLSMPCADTEGTPSRQPASRDGAGNACSQCQCIHYGLCNTSINNAIAASAASAARPQQQQQQQLDGVSDNEDLVLYFLERQRMTETGQIVVSEWRQVAAAVDRILFWVFCVITCVSSALFLLIIPGINRGWFTSSSAHASPFWSPSSPSSPHFQCQSWKHFRLIQCCWYLPAHATFHENETTPILLIKYVKENVNLPYWMGRYGIGGSLWIWFCIESYLSLSME